MRVVADLPAEPWAAKPAQVGEGALNEPASGARRPGAVLGAAAGDQRFHAETADEAAVLAVVVFVAAVARHHIKAALHRGRP